MLFLVNVVAGLRPRPPPSARTLAGQLTPANMEHFDGHLSVDPTIRVRGACPHDCPDTCGIWTDVTCRTAGPSASAANWNTRSRRAGSAPRCGPTSTASTIPTACSIPCGASDRRAAAQWERITWDAAIAEICWALAAHHRRARRRGHPAVLLQRHARAGAERRRGGAAVQPPRRQRVAAHDLRRRRQRGRRGDARRANGRPIRATCATRKLVLLWGHNPASTTRTSCRCCVEAQRDGATSSSSIRAARSDGAFSRRAHPPAPGHRRRAGARTRCTSSSRKACTTRPGWEPTPSAGAQLRERAADYPPERVAEITGLAADDNRRAGAPLRDDQAGAAEDSRTASSGTATAARQCAPCCVWPAVTGNIGTRRRRRLLQHERLRRLGRRRDQPRRRMSADRRASST